MESPLNLFAACKPTGIIAKALYSGRKAVFMSCTLVFIFCSVVWALQLSKLKETWRQIYAIVFCFHNINRAIIVYSVYWNRDNYIDCFNHFEFNANINTISPSLIKYLAKNRLIISTLLLSAFVCYSIAVIMALIEFHPQIWHFIIKMSAITCYYFYLNFYVESCLYIQSCFMQVEHQIDLVNHSNSTLSLAKVRQVRRLYCIAIETTEKLNSLLLPATATYFVLSLIVNHYVFSNVISFPSLRVTLMFIAEFTAFFVVTYHIIYVNHLAVRIYEKVYSFSFKTDAVNVSKEIQLLLTRIARTDVGLTWLNIFVITPTCVTSLATISLTITLAVPTLIKLIRF
uniref:Gustatory receptor n=1 Tax=Tetranychus urticae TaxID=32264 RepID=T1KAN4_TETUR